MLVVCLLSSLSVAQLLVQTALLSTTPRPLSRMLPIGGGGGGSDPTPKPTVKPTVACSLRSSCKTCIADSKCAFDPAYGCVDGSNICFTPGCVRNGGTCPACSAQSSCDKCTSVGCFWTATNQCQDVKCSSCKKYGDCFLPGCSAFKTCSTCLPQAANGVQCQWNMQAQSCDAGCYRHSPDVPLTCVKQGGTCPAPPGAVGGGIGFLMASNAPGPSDPTVKPTVKPTVACSSRFTCKTCAAADGKCVWDLKTGCISAENYICFSPCVRQAAQCPACSTLTSQGCGICTDRGCFWNQAGTGTCQEVKCSSCLKNGDCVPPGCSQYKQCGNCIGAVDPLSKTACQWNVGTKTCDAGCFHQPDVPATCIAKGGTCPALSTITPVFGTAVPLGTIGAGRISTVAPVLTTIPRCTLYKTCSTCLKGAAPGSTTCTWNAHSNSCLGGCIHDPDVPYKCLKAPQTCPITTVKPVIVAATGVMGTVKPSFPLGPTGITMGTVGPLSLTCGSRSSCKACANDGKCAWDPSVGCVSSDNFCFNQYCARTPAQCQVCSTFSNCGSCTDRGCFWNPSTSTCVDTKTATTKKYGDCIPAGCSQYTSCQTCLPATAPLANPATTCTWNAHSKKCEAGCFHEPDAPYSCFKSPQKCPA